MPLTPHENEAGAFRLHGELTVMHAAALKDELLAALAHADTLALDLGEVEDIDTAGVQLLLLLKREAARLGRSVSYGGHSGAVLAALELLDLTGALGDPVLMPKGA
ncbi:STAS domain-containing protein [Chitiniphilus eburneus]|uniref:STAS domain-containing protein n=1 Tax=Chitiniphilus eburneus TaxID=2571148 RepID=A0A4U0QCI3_9NEIS|nr:STAS domain-containing protein [Chitiniphilus eburneus]TJZ79006.1 STAS domain-containing protein [Chitiniphilus eburneus]